MSAAAFTPPTAAEILARLADPQFAAVVAEFAAAEIAWQTSYATADAGARSQTWDALVDASDALRAAIPGAAEAYKAQSRIALRRNADEVAA